MYELEIVGRDGVAGAAPAAVPTAVNPSPGQPVQVMFPPNWSPQQLAAVMVPQGMAIPPALQQPFPAPGYVQPLPQNPQVQPRGMGKLRRQTAPLPITVCAAAAVTNIIFRPQRAIRLERLVLQSTVQPSLCFVTGIMVGADNEFVNAGGVPVGVFGPGSQDIMLRGFTAQPGTDVVITIQNTAPAVPETIAGAIIGETLDMA